MICPNCRQNLTLVKFGSVEVLHCQNCGGNFFEENEINRISLSNAHKLAKDKQTYFISSSEKLCPKDNLPLRTIQEESVPQFVTLLRCERCRGVFAFPEDLVNFKKAQQVKLNFFKTWRLPLPSLKTVLVYSFLIFTAVSTLFSFSVFNVHQSLQTQADEVVKSIKISRVDNITVVYFITKTAFQSEAIFNDKRTGKQTRKIISSKPTTSHFLTISNVPPAKTITLRIILISGKTRLETQPILFIPR